VIEYLLQGREGESGYIAEGKKEKQDNEQRERKRRQYT
jgi:hypothetical protein